MADKKKYDLIGLDNECILTGKHINMSSPDITSIISAFENNKNPADLFSHENNELSGSIINERLNYVYNNLDNIKMWFDRILTPSLQMLNSEDVRQCIPILDLIDTNTRQLYSRTKRFRKQFIKKRVSRPQKCYDANCPTCNKFFYLKKPNDWFVLEDHDHIAEILSSGDAFNLPPADDTVEEIIDCNDMNKLEVNIDETKKKITVNSETNAQQFVKNTFPICIYNAQIRSKLYPLKITSNVSHVENNFNFYTIQAVAPTRYQCLLCKSDMYHEQSVYAHISGNKHTNKLANHSLNILVVNYHKIFSAMPQEVQIHQVFFRPSYKLDFVFCKVCVLQISSDKLKQHINTDMHRIRLNTKKFSKFYYFEETLKSICLDNSEDESSEITIPSHIIYNSENKITAALISTTNKQSGSTDEDEDSEEETSETSSKSQSEDSSAKQQDPLQGSSKMNSVSVESPEKNSDAQNGKSTSENNEKPAPVKHNIVPAFKENPNTLFDHLENRYQVHVEYIKFVNSEPQCTLCMKILPKPVKEIKNHFASPEHKKNAEIHCGKQKFWYYCDLCYKNIRNNEYKWSEHLSCIEHRQRVNSQAIPKLKELRGGPFIEYECTTCNLVLYGNQFTIKRHVNDNFEFAKKAKKVKEIKLPQQMVNLFRSEQLFNEDIYKLSRESTEVLKSTELSWECCRAIEKALEPVFGQCKAYAFGSRISGLGNLVSDLDVFVDTGLMYEGMVNQDAESQAKLVNLTAKALKKHKDFVDVFAIPNARTPIVQVFHKVTGLDCDLSFRHGLSVENTEFLRLCIDVQPKLKTLILFLKRWSHFCKFTDRISTYALSMLCIFFFQQKGLLPSLTTLREIDPTDCKVIAGWYTFCFTKPLTELSKNYPPCNLFTRDILTEFFEYYVKFKFNTEVVCPLLGHTVLKSDFYEEKGKRLPVEMKTYVTKINASEENEVFRSLSPMCIQDPFDLSHNLTKACPKDVVNKFVTLCQLSYAVLSKKT